MLRATLRKLLRTPGFTAIAILTLALGIGANAAIFSVVHGVLVQPLPYPDSQDLVSVDHVAPALEMEDLPNSEATYLTYATLSRTLDAYGVYQNDIVNLTGLERPERTDAARLTATVFEVLRQEPILGPGMADADNEPDAEPVVLVSEGMWQERLGGGEDVLGRTLRLDGVEHRVVGVMAEDFEFPRPETKLWLPLSIDAAEPNDGNFNFRGVGRLAAGNTAEDAQRELAALLPRMVEMFGTDISLEMLESTGLAPRVSSFKERVVGDVGDVLWVLLGTVALILLIACANVANLFLVRAEGRQREVAVRTALGAARRDLARGFLGESLSLGLLGGVAGLLLALAGVQALVAFGPESIPRLHEVGITAPVLAFTFSISVFAGLLFGAVPMLRFGRGFSLVGALKEGGGRGSTTGRDRHFARNALVVFQVALALVLLVGSGLMLRSFHSLRQVDPGFEPQGVLTLQVSLAEADYPEGEEVARVYQEMVDRVAALPGVEAAGAGNLPMDNQRSMSVHTFEGQPVAPGEVPPVVPNVRVVPGYFDALGQRLVSGRLLERADHETPRPALLVNETLAQKFWPGEDPLGKRLQMGMQSEDDEGDWAAGWYSVVGVVEDVRFDGPAEEVPPMIYYANGPTVGESGWFARTLTLAVRTAPGVHPLSLAEPVRQVIWDLDPNLPVASVGTAEEIVDAAMARTSFTMLLLLIAAVVALVLGAVGLYGVISYIVSLRTQEIGVRMALGAPAGEVARRVVGQGLAVAGVGAAVGLVAAFALTRLLSSLLFGVSATDPLTFAGVSGTLLATAVLASWLPARRAAAVDPLVALRHE